jgi:hypothetical protein
VDLVLFWGGGHLKIFFTLPNPAHRIIPIKSGKFHSRSFGNGLKKIHSHLFLIFPSITIPYLVELCLVLVEDIENRG